MKELKDYTVEDIRQIRFPYNEEQLLKVLEDIKKAAENASKCFSFMDKSSQEPIDKDVLTELERRGFNIEIKPIRIEKCHQITISW